MKNKRIVNVRKRFVLGEDMAGLRGALELIRDALAQTGTTPRLAQMAELLAEETIVQFAAHAPAGAALQVQVRRFLGDTGIHLSMAGEEFDPYTGVDGGETAAEDPESEDALRAILLRSHGEKFKYRRTRGVNHARILTGQSEKSANRATIFAMLLGVAFGLLARFVLPSGFADAVGTWVLAPVQTMFMNALRIVIAPVVFFSIVTCFSQFNSIRELGRLGAKVFGVYMMTTVIAVLLGFGMYALFRPGEWGFALAGGAAEEAAAVAAGAPSFLDTIVRIVPDNFIKPFVEADTLQIIFLAVLCGAAVGMIGMYSAVLRQLFEALNSLFLTIITIIAKCIPVAVFASVALMIKDLGGSSVMAVLGAGGVNLLAIAVMLAIYGLLVWIMARLNPATFFRNNREGMLTSMALCSSSASMPTNMRVARDKMGVSPKVANFAIPLGATINMDGACIHLCIMGLFIAKAYGVAVPPTSIFSLALTIILLSLASPGVPGAAAVALSVVLRTLNVPVEGVTLVLAIAPFIDMFQTMSNTTGDMTAAVIVARSENLLDLETYNAK